MQGHAARQVCPRSRQQQAAVRRGILSGQAGEFLFETLKTEAESQRRRIFLKERARLAEMLRRDRLRNRDGRRRTCTGYPMRMPPLTFSTWPVM
jgi:hypothetical protein